MDNYGKITENEARLFEHIDSQSLLTEMKVLIAELYIATVSEENGLKVTFDNGQSFLLAITEI